MLVGVQQTIKDPKKFWQVAEETLPNLPGGLRLLSVLPSQDGRLCNCLWECDSVQHMQRFMDKNWGESCENHCYEVNAAKAIGLR